VFPHKFLLSNAIQGKEMQKRQGGVAMPLGV
jgi:hypothetical protein